MEVHAIGMETKMSKSLESAVASYLKARSLSTATGVEYRSTLSKWKEWNKQVPIECIGRSEVREFLDWVHDRATVNKGGNPGRTANKCREHLRVVLSWAWEQELIETLPKFPQTKKQRDVAGIQAIQRGRASNVAVTYLQSRRSPGS